MSNSLQSDTWTVAHQASLHMEFSRQEFWDGLSFPFPGNLHHPRIEPSTPTLTGVFFTTSATWAPQIALWLTLIFTPPHLINTLGEYLSWSLCQMIRDWKVALGNTRKPTYLAYFMAQEVCTCFICYTFKSLRHSVLETKNPTHKD